MKKLVSLCIALVLCLMSATAFAVHVPMSSRNLPDMPTAPDAPQIIRMQKEDAILTLTLDRVLPAESLVTVLGIDADYMLVSINAAPGENNTHTAIGLPDGGEWTGVEIAWVNGAENALARYNAAGGLESVTVFDRDLNEYLFDSDGVFFEFAYASTAVRARFDSRGVMTRYGYKPFRNTIVWFSPEGDTVSADYHDGEFAATWEPGYGWYVLTSAGRMKVKLNVDPWNAKPLIPKEDDEEEEEPEIVWFPNNTISLAGLTLQEASESLPDKWYNVIPINLTVQGRQTYFLTISNVRYIGKCYVDVWGDEVTVSYSLIDHSAIEPLSSYGRWFTRLSQITEDSIESTANGFTFGQPVSISEDLDGADVALLFIRSKATYYQPFLDGTELNRYWRNLVEWKEFRKNLQELMPYVEK